MRADSAPPMVFETPRCTVRCMTSTDGDAVVSLLTDPLVWRHLGGPKTAAEAADRLTAYLDDHPVRVACTCPGDGFVGLLFLHPHHDERDVELSYLLAPQHWGRGLATELIGAALDRAEQDLGLRRVVAETQATNAASCRVLEKVGMRPERHLVRFGAKQVLYATTPRP